MISRFDKFVRVRSATSKALPLTHATDSWTLRDVLESDKLIATECAVFNGDKLLYLFYGRAAYRANLSQPSSGLRAYAPICFILSPSMNITIERIFPFDSGGFHNGIFDPHLHHRMKKEDFSLTPEMDSARKVVDVFFSVNEKYFDNSPKIEFSTSALDFEAESFYEMITTKQRDKYDDRISAIEIQSGTDIMLKGNVSAVVLPDSVMDDEEVKSKLLEWGAEPLIYKFVPRFKSNEYASQISTMVRDFLKQKGYFDE